MWTFNINRLKLEIDNVRSRSVFNKASFALILIDRDRFWYKKEEQFQKEGEIVKLREEKAVVSYQRRRIFYEFDHLVHDFQLCFSEVLVATNCELLSFYRALFPRLILEYCKNLFLTFLIDRNTRSKTLNHAYIFLFLVHFHKVKEQAFERVVWIFVVLSPLAFWQSCPLSYRA